MSFLDNQATGQIGIGEKANLSTLTRRRRKRKKGQAPTGSETYSLMPQNEFSNIVSSPTDIQQVGIGNLLQAQGSSAGKVPNVFEEYKSAAPIGSTIDAIYPQPEDDEEDDDEEEDAGTTDKLPDMDPGNVDDSGYEWGTPTEVDPNSLLGAILTPVANVFGNLTKGAEKVFRGLAPKHYANVDRTTAFDEAGGKVATPLGKTALDAYNLDSFANNPSGKAPGPAAGGRGGSTNMTITDIAAMNAAIDAGGAGGGLSIGEAAGLGSESSTDSMDVTMPDLGGDDLGTWGFASGGTVKSKNKNSFMSMKGK